MLTIINVSTVIMNFCRVEGLEIFVFKTLAPHISKYQLNLRLSYGLYISKSTPTRIKSKVFEALPLQLLNNDQSRDCLRLGQLSIEIGKLILIALVPY